MKLRKIPTKDIEIQTEKVSIDAITEKTELSVEQKAILNSLQGPNSPFKNARTSFAVDYLKLVSENNPNIKVINLANMVEKEIECNLFDNDFDFARMETQKNPIKINMRNEKQDLDKSEIESCEDFSNTFFKN